MDIDFIIKLEKYAYLLRNIFSTRSRRCSNGNYGVLNFHLYILVLTVYITFKYNCKLYDMLAPLNQ